MTAGRSGKPTISQSANVMRTLALLAAIFMVSAAHLLGQALSGGTATWIKTSQADAVQFSHDGKYFLAVQRDSLRFWETATAQQVGPAYWMASGYYVAFLPGDSAVLSIGYDRDSSARIWNWRTGTDVQTIYLYRSPYEAVVSADGRLLIVKMRQPEDQYEAWSIPGRNYLGKFENSTTFRFMQVDSVGSRGLISRGGRYFYRVDIPTFRIDTQALVQDPLSVCRLSTDGERIGCSRSRGPTWVCSRTSFDSLFALAIDDPFGTRTTLTFTSASRWIVALTTQLTGSAALKIWDGMSGAFVSTVGSDSVWKYGNIVVSPGDRYVVVYGVVDGIGIVPLQLPNSSAPVVTGNSDRGVQAHPNPCTEFLDIKYNGGPLVRPGVVSVDGRAVDCSIRCTGIADDQSVHVETRGIPAGRYYFVATLRGRGVTVPFEVVH